MPAAMALTCPGKHWRAGWVWRLTGCVRFTSRSGPELWPVDISRWMKRRSSIWNPEMGKHGKDIFGSVQHPEGTWFFIGTPAGPLDAFKR